MSTIHSVPQSVRDAIQQTEHRSEILISLFQVGFVLLMGVLYFLAPKGYSGDVPIRPVPLVLVAYAPLVLVRLILALRHRLTPAVLNVSIVVDITMICILLWTFHIQYEQPAGFYLKAPTAFYLFIFVALRALRYDPRYILFAGSAAAVGWIVLTIYAIRADSGITRDFVSYVTGTEVLVGAQVDRIIAILVITAILAVAVKRNGDLLMRSATEGRAREEMSRYFSPEVVDRILTSQERYRPGEGEVRDAATLMVDLRGFSTWAESIEPDKVMSALAEYQRIVVRIVLRHRGSIDKFMGDGVLCHFGAASDSDTCSADAFRCAIQIRSELIKWRDGREARGQHAFEFGIALANGNVIFGAVGGTNRLEFTVIGSPVNTCAKLEKHSKRLGAHVVAPVAMYKAAVEQGLEQIDDAKIARGQSVEGIDASLDLAVVARTS